MRRFAQLRGFDMGLDSSLSTCCNFSVECANCTRHVECVSGLWVLARAWSTWHAGPAWAFYEFTTPLLFPLSSPFCRVRWALGSSETWGSCSSARHSRLQELLQLSKAMADA